MNMGYITVMTHPKWLWQRAVWPDFDFDPAGFSGEITAFLTAAHRLDGRAEALSEPARQAVMVDLMATEAASTMEIEGERPDRETIVNIIMSLMGYVRGKGLSLDSKSEGVALLMADIRKRWARPLTHERLYAWQQALIPESGRPGITRGAYRHGEVRVVSGPLEDLRVHYQAPPPDRVMAEMDRFIDWFNDSLDRLPGPVRAGVAHLWFEMIHPFDDGNGRVGRAIADLALSQALGFPTLGCLAAAIARNRPAYYHELEQAQSGDGHIQRWLGFFCERVAEAQRIALGRVDFMLDRARFFDRFGGHLNARQQTALEAVFQRGPERFAEGLSPRRYKAITGCSTRTAHRDMAGLVRMGAIAKVPGTATRNVRYTITRAGPADETSHPDPPGPPGACARSRPGPHAS